MPIPQNFRSSLKGFNRDDVVAYIQHINSRHSDQVRQLESQIQNLKDELGLSNAKLLQQEDSNGLEELQARCAALEQENEALRAAQAVPQATLQISSEAELEAYRRAERSERLAQQRSAQVYQTVNGVLADATVQVEQASNQVGAAADLAIAQIQTLTQQLAEQMQQLQAAVRGSKESLEKAADTMAAIRPTAEEQ